MKLKRLFLGRKVMTNIEPTCFCLFKSRDITLVTKVHLVKAMVFPVHVWRTVSGLWRKLSAEELMLLNCGVGEDSWESLGLQGDPTKGDQSWVFIGRTDVEAETPILWPLHAKSWLIEKDSDAGRDWGQEENGTTEDGMAGWHHWLDGRESEWTLRVGDGQGGLACCDSWGCIVGHDWAELNHLGSLATSEWCISKRKTVN